MAGRDVDGRDVDVAMMLLMDAVVGGRRRGSSKMGTRELQRWLVLTVDSTMAR